MRDAEEVVDEIVCAIIDCYEPEPGMAKAKPILEADRRAAQIAVLREIQRSVQNRNEGAAWSIRIRDKIAALEKEGGAT